MCCPNCRGPDTVVAIWNYINTDVPTQQVGGVLAESLLPNGHTSHVTSDAHLAVFDTPSSIYHSDTRLRDGRQSIIADPGSVGI